MRIYEKSCDMPVEIRYVEYESLEYYYEIATAALWIDNCRKGSDIRKRDGQSYIQAWHGAAPFKKVEKDMPLSFPNTYFDNAVKDSEMADLFLSGSRFYSALYRSSFWYDGEIMEAGLPRQDILFHADGIKERIYDKYKVDPSALLVLYAPTYRDSLDMKIYNLDFTACRTAIEKKFNRRAVFGISKHPSNRGLDYYMEYDSGHIDMSDHEDFEELLVAADILISDYSGCVYDYSFLNRPVFLYQPDLESYIHERDFYYSMQELPYPHAGSNEDMMRIIESFDLEKYKSGLHDFMNKMGNFDDGNASQKVAVWILRKLRIGYT